MVDMLQPPTTCIISIRKIIWQKRKSNKKWKKYNQQQ